MRRLLSALVRACAFAALAAALSTAPAAAQMPPMIKKPLDAARKAAAATNRSVEASQKTGEVTTGVQPAEAAMKAGPNTAQGAKSAPGGRPATKADSARAKTAADSAGRRGTASQSGGKGTVTFYREEFAYDAENRRDPFLSLLATGELKPLLTDLALIGVIYDNAAPNRSVAVLEDGSNKDTYRVRVGQIVGRMKVVRIGQQDITFAIDEFGFSRQETLPLDMTRKAGGQPGRRPQ
jgi:hypothetical protein